MVVVVKREREKQTNKAAALLHALFFYRSRGQQSFYFPFTLCITVCLKATIVLSNTSTKKGPPGQGSYITTLRTARPLALCYVRRPLPPKEPPDVCLFLYLFIIGLWLFREALITVLKFFSHTQGKGSGLFCVAILGFRAISLVVW